MTSPSDKMDPAFRNLRDVDFTEYGKVASGEATLMGWADPFYPDPSIPPHVLAAMKRALEQSGAHYTLPIGLPELRSAISGKLKRYNGIEADPEKEIVITPGADTGLYYAMRPFITAGTNQEVLNPDPSYANNFRNSEILGARSISVPLWEEDRFQINIREFEKRVTGNTRLVVLTHPNNPTSTVYSRKNLEALARFVVERDLMLVVDQAFEDIIFDGREYVSPATLPDMWERTVTVFSISKGMGLSGLRVGYIVACEEIMTALYGGAVYIMGAPNTTAQHGAIAALENDSFVQTFKEIHDARRRIAFDLLNEIPGVHCLLPESGFMVWVNVAELGNSASVTRFLAEQARVAVNAGDKFGCYGEGYIRIILGTLARQEEYEAAIGRVASSLRKLSRKRKT